MEKGLSGSKRKRGKDKQQRDVTFDLNSFLGKEDDDDDDDDDEEEEEEIKRYIYQQLDDDDDEEEELFGVEAHPSSEFVAASSQQEQQFDEEINVLPISDGKEEEEEKECETDEEEKEREAGKFLVNKYTSHAETASKTFGFVDASGLILGQPSFLRLAKGYVSSCDEDDDDDDDDECLNDRRRRRRRRHNKKQRRRYDNNNSEKSSWLQRYERGDWVCLGCAYTTTTTTTAAGGRTKLSAIESCMDMIKDNFMRMEPLQLSKAVHRLYKELVPNAGQPGYPPLWHTMDIYAHLQMCIQDPRVWIANTVRRLRTLQLTLSEMMFEKDTEIPSDAARKLLKEIQCRLKDGGGGGGNDKETDPATGLPRWMMEAARPKEKLRLNQGVFAAFTNAGKEITRLLALDPKKMLFYQSDWKVQLESAGALMRVAGAAVEQ